MAKKRAYRVIDPNGLNLEFYQSYEWRFFISKAWVLYLALTQAEAFRSFVRAHSGDGEDGIDEQVLRNLEVELHCCAFQQFEALLALLLAAFQPQPHWLYLTVYTTAEIKEAAKNLKNGDFAKLTGGKCQDGRTFSQTAMYAGVRPEPALDLQKWTSSLDDVTWFLQMMSGRYLDAPEFNAYKHWLRVVSGGFSLHVALEGGESKTFSPVMQMPNSVSYLEFGGQMAHGEIEVKRTTKEIRGIDAFNSIRIMTSIGEITRNCRLAILERRERVEIKTLLIDRDGLASIRPVNRLSISV